MMSLIVVLGVVLVLAILYMIFRVSNLVGIAKGKKEEKKGATPYPVDYGMKWVRAAPSLNRWHLALVQLANWYSTSN